MFSCADLVSEMTSGIEVRAAIATPGIAAIVAAPNPLRNARLLARVILGCIVAIGMDCRVGSAPSIVPPGLDARLKPLPGVADGYGFDACPLRKIFLVIIALPHTHLMK